MGAGSHAALVWLPFPVENLGEVPDTLRYETVDPREQVPESVAEVAFYVTPYAMAASVGGALGQMKSLEVVQTLSAGVDHVRSLVPAGVTLCNGRGIHETSTAELVLTLILASLRGTAHWVADAQQGTWRPSWRPALADKRVLIVGYGSIGEAVERRLVPFETEVVRVARTARPHPERPVHGMGELNDLVPTADVVVLLTPLTAETRHLVDGEFLARMRPGSLLVNAARGGVVDTDALVAALEGHHLAAALDVTDPEPLPSEHPLWRAPNADQPPWWGSHQRHVAARPPVGSRAVGALRRGRTLGQRDVGGLLSHERPDRGVE